MSVDGAVGRRLFDVQGWNDKIQKWRGMDNKQSSEFLSFRYTK